MKPRNTLLHSVQIWTILALSILTSACNGQQSQEAGQTAHSVPVSEHPQPAESAAQAPYWPSDYSDQISQVVRMVFQDSQGTIWFATQSGAFRLTGDSLVLMEGITNESGRGNPTIKSIAEGRDGTIWFGHTDGISSLKDGSVVNYKESDGLISKDVWNLEVDRHGNVWIGTIAGACRFNGQEFTPFNLPEGKIDSTLGVSSTQMVHDILEDRDGAIWFSTNAGLFQFADNSLINVSEKVGIPTNFVNDLLQDNKGAFWISTKQALYKLQGDQLEHITRDLPDIGKGIGSMVEDKAGTLWFVCNQHQLYTYDGEALLEFQKPADNPGPVIYHIFQDQSDRLWFVGFGGAYRLEDGEFVNVSKDGPW